MVYTAFQHSGSAVTSFIEANAGIAQLVEQLICNQQVVGSNPTAGLPYDEIGEHSYPPINLRNTFRYRFARDSRASELHCQARSWSMTGIQCAFQNII